LDTFFQGSPPEVPPLGASLGTFPTSTAEGSTNPLTFIPVPFPSSPSSVVVVNPQPVLEPVGIDDPHQSSVFGTGSKNTSHSNVSATHYCNEHKSLPSDSIPVDIFYQYEVVLSHSIELHDALTEIKKEVMATLAASLSCTTESRMRNLLQEQDSTLIGIQEGFDMVDTDKELCSKASFSGCIPIVSHLTGYFGSATSAEGIQKTRNRILNTIRQGMLDGRYNSDKIRWIVFSSDDAKSLSLESVYVIPPVYGSSDSVWVPIATTLICSLTIVIAVVVVSIFKRMKIPSIRVMPASSSVIEKLQNPEEHSSDESNRASLESDESICLDDYDVEFQQSQDMVLPRPQTKILSVVATKFQVKEQQ
jgi:hypothetical protein